MRLKDNRPSLTEIGYGGFRFLITDRPQDAHITVYLEEISKYGVTHVVRVCEPSYKTELIEERGIHVVDLAYDDGSYPPDEVLSEWFNLLKGHKRETPDGCVAVHCVAGLGRAPVMVATALIELGLKYEDAVSMIREKRRGAINSKQLHYLQKYRPNNRLYLRAGHNTGNNCCIIL